MISYFSMRMREVFLAVSLMCILIPPQAAAMSYPYGMGNMVIGEVQTYEVESEESLIEIARDFDVGYNQIESANPTLDPFVPGEEAMVTVPTSWILPEVSSSTLRVISYPYMRPFSCSSFTRVRPTGP